MLELMKLHFLEVEQAGVLGGIVVLRPADKINDMAATLPADKAEEEGSERAEEEAPGLVLGA
jgi:hypothetical protein